MALVKVKPTSAGRRGVVKVVSAHLHKGKPLASLTEPKIRGSGRNNSGRITIRHKGGGHKQTYRLIDFKRDKEGIGAKVERLEYDPNRSAHIALLVYADGERRYIIAPERCGSRRAIDERQRSADSRRQHAAVAQYSGRYDDSLRRDAARQRSADGARRRHVSAVAGARRQLRTTASCAPARFAAC